MTHGKISKRLLLRVLVISGILTVVFTSTQVTLDYYNRIDSFRLQVEDIVGKTAYGIAAAVRLNDTPTIAGASMPITSFAEKTALIVHRDDESSPPIIYESKEGVIDESKHATSSTDFHSVTTSLEVVFIDSETNEPIIDEKVGELEVIVGMGRVKEEAIENLLNIIALQFIKTFFSSFLILMMLNYFLIKRLQKLQNWVETFVPTAEFVELKIDNTKKADELDTMAETINRMGESLHKYSVKMHSIVEDKTHELKLKNEELESARSQLHKILQQKDNVISHVSNGLGTWLWELDPFGNLINLSEECLNSICFRYKENTPLSFENLDVVCPETSILIVNSIKNALTQREPFCLEDIEVKSPDGRTVFIKIEGQPCFIDQEYTGFTGSIIDSTEKIRLTKLAYSDGLTGLPNRTAFNLAVNRAIKRANRHRYEVGLLIIDIDHFKAVNDTYGHDAGDRVLKKVSQIISSSLREEDVPARLGGEEFSIVAPDITRDGLSSLAQRINKNVAKHKIKILNTALTVTVSIGGSIFERDESLEDAIKRADTLLYDAKDKGRNRYLVG